MGEALLLQINDMVQSLFVESVVTPWDAASMTPSEKAILERECTSESEFDELRSREIFYRKYKAGKLVPVVRANRYGKVIALLQHPSQVGAIPWDLWSRILQGFARPDGRKYTIFLCAHPAPRMFPREHGAPVRPLHINGGYTYPCDPTCIFVYRAEDATRVLIHELFHAACADRKGVGLEQMEAETEAWAELFWCAFISRGDLKAFRSLVAKQGLWMRGQVEELLAGRHMANDGTDTPFPWRYTVGKMRMWQRWGIFEKCGDPVRSSSLRLTVPLPAIVYRKFDVPVGSPFL